MTPEQIDDRLRQLGIPHESVERTGLEPLFMHITVDGRVAKWYPTTAAGIIAMKSDIATIEARARITIELGRPAQRP
jgi:hypothetical protein